MHPIVGRETTIPQMVPTFSYTSSHFHGVVRFNGPLWMCLGHPLEACVLFVFRDGCDQHGDNADIKQPRTSMIFSLLLRVIWYFGESAALFPKILVHTALSTAHKHRPPALIQHFQMPQQPQHRHTGRTTGSDTQNRIPFAGTTQCHDSPCSACVGGPWPGLQGSVKFRVIKQFHSDFWLQSDTQMVPFRQDGDPECPVISAATLESWRCNLSAMIGQSQGASLTGQRTSASRMWEASSKMRQILIIQHLNMSPNFPICSTCQFTAVYVAISNPIVSRRCLI